MSVLRLDRNEGPAPDARLLEALGGSAAETMRRYPSPARLEAALAELIGVNTDQVLVTAGADDAIDRCCRRFLGAGRVLLTTTPSFPLIAGFARLCGARVQEVAWTGSPFPGAAFAASLPFADLAAVVSPNNPTGFVLGPDDLGLLAAAAGDTPLLLDHTYVEYADHDLTRAALAYPHGIVVRTLSKAWGMAGCRIGYALARPDVIAALRSAGQPFAVAGPSLVLAQARLARGAPHDHVQRVRQERDDLESMLGALRIEAGRSQANFVLGRFGSRAAFVRGGLSTLGITVRDCRDQPLLPGALRISLPGDEAGYRRLRAALETLLAPQALLFDLDGVLADVRLSYDQCITRTAAAFGVTLADDAIARVRNDGDANDDWLLTHALLRGNGRDVSLEAVTERFQQTYLGSPGQDGLRHLERWLPPSGLLERLSRRTRLGIVTGRPREEAEWLLRREGVRGLFDCVVTRDDAPLKPDPAPVRVALRRLGADRAWLIGDTPDDVRAALGAGVVPLGIPAPGANGAAAAAMRAAGAALILESLAELEGLWT